MRGRGTLKIAQFIAINIIFVGFPLMCIGTADGPPFESLPAAEKAFHAVALLLVLAAVIFLFTTAMVAIVNRLVNRDKTGDYS